MIIDGKQIATDILERLKKMPVPTKFLSAVLVGDNAASKSFLKQKEKIARVLGVDFRLRAFPCDIEKNVLIREIQKIADDPACGGVIIQLPLPDPIHAQEMLDVVPPKKDIDVLGARALTLFSRGESSVVPPAVGVVSELLSTFHVPRSTSAVAVVGAGKLVGQPIATWLKGKVKEIFIIDKSDDLAPLKNADLVICGAGVPGLVLPSMLKANAFVIDFGYGMLGGKVTGDFDASNSPFPVTGSQSYTPTPGGTGPILVAKLFENFYILNAT